MECTKYNQSDAIINDLLLRFEIYSKNKII
jgi:hypothetical protein